MPAPTATSALVDAVVLLDLWSGRRSGTPTQTRHRRRGPQVPRSPRQVGPWSWPCRSLLPKQEDI